ncbi:transcriptional regulator/antitoxin, MazE [bacterium]|nr:transcriptional regulator/antitoxin, MazE [bacterium]
MGPQRELVDQWGNSHGLRLTKQVLLGAKLSVGDAVDVTVRDGAIAIVPVKRVRAKCSLRQLVARIPKSYRAEELDWGSPVGEEV